MKKDDIKTFITILVICALIGGLVLILNKKSNSEKLEVVNEYNTFFKVTNYVNNYINNTRYSSSLYDIIYPEYIEQNNITEETIKDYIKEYPINSTIKVTNMKYVKIKENYLYYIKGEIYQNTLDKKELIEENFNTIVIIDFDTLSYSIYPVEENYKRVVDKIKKIKIENNGNNNIKKSELISKEQICVMYLSDYIDKINNNTISAYNLLNSDMKKQYSTLEDFENYINNNIYNITTEADKCSLEKLENKRIYTVIDKKQNKYIFKENNIMDYQVNFYLYENNAENR